ncbi:hypothetical protein ILUMI_12324 [Ignelater luminosus]|uniref:Uncharacterized protein n=1 Tax=Ignelater luminosus TaxID=2038154 RepID=A0A8K0GCE8_IGNLU|nr:hypothetical protein ILUMI_12324 [Ignelater luminosus]
MHLQVPVKISVLWEAEKARLSRIKNDPIKLAEYKEKERLRYLKKKEKGLRKSIKEMTPREQRITRKKWRKYSTDYRQKQSLNRNTSNFVRQNTSSSTSDTAKDPGAIRPKIENKQLKKMNDVMSKLNSQRQKYKRIKKQFKKAIKSVEKIPKTSIEDISEDVTKKKELVTKALFGEAGHGKGAPDGVGAICKRTADQVIARGGDITDFKDFAAVVRERCPSIQVNVIEECEIDQMNALINKNSFKLVVFKGTLSVHQVTGSAYFPNQLKIKSLSCFCDSDGCDH